MSEQSNSIDSSTSFGVLGGLTSTNRPWNKSSKQATVSTYWPELNASSRSSSSMLISFYISFYISLNSSHLLYVLIFGLLQTLFPLFCINHNQSFLSIIALDRTKKPLDKSTTQNFTLFQESQFKTSTYLFFFLSYLCHQISHSPIQPSAKFFSLLSLFKFTVLSFFFTAPHRSLRATPKQNPCFPFPSPVYFLQVSRIRYQ